MTLATPEATTETRMPDNVETEAKTEAEDMLNQPDLINLIEKDLQGIGIVGEEDLSLSLYLVGTSRLLDEPLSAIVRGSSSSGKSFTVDMVASLFHEGTQKVTATEISPKALSYMEDKALVHKFIVGGERSQRTDEEAAEETKILRELQSSGSVTRLVAPRQGTERATTDNLTIEGPIAYVQTTTLEDQAIFAEDRNRHLLLATDESSEQTYRVLHARKPRPEVKGAIQRKHHILQGKLTQAEVEIPYIDDVVDHLPTDSPVIRREKDRVCGMIASVALLHQKQRAQDDQGRIIATLEDYAVAKRLLEPCLRESLGLQLSPALKKNYELIADRGRDAEFTPSDAQAWAEEVGRSAHTMRGHLSELEKRRLVEKVSEASGPHPAQWRLTGRTLREANEILPRPEDLEPAISGSQQNQQA